MVTVVVIVVVVVCFESQDGEGFSKGIRSGAAKASADHTHTTSITVVTA